MQSDKIKKSLEPQRFKGFFVRKNSVVYEWQNRELTGKEYSITYKNGKK